MPFRRVHKHHHHNSSLLRCYGIYHHHVTVESIHIYIYLKLFSTSQLAIFGSVQSDVME